MFGAFEDFKSFRFLGVGVEFLGLLNRDIVVETAVDDQGGSIQLSGGTAQVVSFPILEIRLCEPLS